MYNQKKSNNVGNLKFELSRDRSLNSHAAPSTAASNYFTNGAHESSVRLAKHPGMNPIRQNTDRIKIHKVGSALSHKVSPVVSHMAVQPFSRTGYGHALMDNIIRSHKLNFDYASDSRLGPSDDAMKQLREKE